MRAWKVAVVSAFAVGVVGCGGAPLEAGDGTGGGGGDPGPAAVPCEQTNTCPAQEVNLWPLTPGSRWVYELDDTEDGKPLMQKMVEVIGEQDVPGMPGRRATAVISRQPALEREERSWQVTSGALVHRVREDDYLAGKLEKFTTWEPDTVKNVAVAQEVGWKTTSTIKERESLADGTVETKERSYIWEVLAVKERVTVPAGTFEALKVQRTRADDPTKTRTYWLVPGVGKVYETGTERTERLLSFDVKKQ